MRTRPNVLAQPAAPPRLAAAHFRDRLAFEADCADVAADLAAFEHGIVLVDCRSPRLYAAGHIPGAVNIPHRRITAETVLRLIGDENALIITYCNGPHCNASTKGALRLAELGRSVKEMPGGMDGWIREGLVVESDPTSADPADHGVRGEN